MVNAAVNTAVVKTRIIKVSPIHRGFNIRNISASDQLSSTGYFCFWFLRVKASSFVWLQETVMSCNLDMVKSYSLFNHNTLGSTYIYGVNLDVVKTTTKLGCINN